MRIDILPMSTSSAVEPGVAKPDGGQSSDGGAFSSIIGQMTAPRAEKTREAAEYSAPEAEKKDDQAGECKSAPILPFAFADTGTQPRAMPGGFPATTASADGRRQNAAEGSAGGNAAACSAPADPSSTLFLCTEVVTNSTNSDAGTQARMSPGINAEAADTAPAAELLAPGTAAPSTGITIPVAAIAEAPSREFPTPHPTLQKSDAGLFPESATAMVAATAAADDLAHITPARQTPATGTALQAAVDPTSDTAGNDGRPILTVSSSEKIKSSIFSMPSQAAAAAVPEAENPQVQAGESSTPTLASPQADADLPLEAARVPAPIAVVTATDAIREEASTGAVPTMSTIPSAIPTAPSEPSRPEAMTPENSSPEEGSTDGSVALRAPTSERTLAASVIAPAGPEGVAQNKTTGARRTPEFSAVRGHDKESLAATRRAPTADQNVTVSLDPESLADSSHGSGVFATYMDSHEEESLQKDPRKMTPAVKPAEGESKMQATPGRVESTVDSAGSAWADTQSAQRMLFRSPAQTSNTDAPVPGVFRTLVNATSATSASWSTGLQLPNLAAGTELKSILAQLTPKQVTAAQATDFLAQLTGRIGMQLRDNQNILTIRLKPSSLGRMEIKAETSAAGVLATILTESAGVKDYLERHLTQLQQTFQDHGLKIVRINVVLQEGSWLQQPSSGQHESRSHSSEHSESGAHSGAHDKIGQPIEELALDQQTLLALRPHSTFHAIA